MDSASQTPPSEPAPRPQTRRKSKSPRILQSALGAAILVATLFIAFAPNTLSGNLNDQLVALLTTQPDAVAVLPGTPRPQIKIGIVAGHWGNDSGAVCDNGTTEQEVNLKIATLVQQKLGALGFDPILLKEFDTRLSGFRAAVLVSIHNDSCKFVNDQATGFKVAAAMSSRDTNLANRLAGCLRNRYQQITKMSPHNSVTNDMTLYHAFSEIDPNTTAAIIETGFLKLDYEILTNNTELVATGVTNGIVCFINNENLEPTPTP